MIVHDFTGTENHPIYQALAVDNGQRQYDFLRSTVAAALRMQQPYLSSTLLRALNFHAIACLHPYAGEYRPCPVRVGEDYNPPQAFQVPSLMEDFISYVNFHWDKADSLALATFVLWRLNFIHPFINGNGRTARAACYYVLCCKTGGWLPGSPTLPEAITQNRDEYVAAIKKIDASFISGKLDLTPLHSMLQRLSMKQVGIDPNAPDAPQPGPSSPPEDPVAAPPSES